MGSECHGRSPWNVRSSSVVAVVSFRGGGPRATGTCTLLTFSSSIKASGVAGSAVEEGPLTSGAAGKLFVSSGCGTNSSAVVVRKKFLLSFPLSFPAHFPLSFPLCLPLSFPVHFRVHFRFHFRFHFHFHFGFHFRFHVRFHFRFHFHFHFRFHSRFQFRPISASISAFMSGSCPLSCPVHFRFISASMSAIISGPFPQEPTHLICPFPENFRSISGSLPILAKICPAFHPYQELKPNRNAVGNFRFHFRRISASFSGSISGSIFALISASISGSFPFPLPHSFPL